jgi:hypothetical protein
MHSTGASPSTDCRRAGCFEGKHAMNDILQPPMIFSMGTYWVLNANMAQWALATLYPLSDEGMCV